MEAEVCREWPQRPRLPQAAGPGCSRLQGLRGRPACAVLGSHTLLCITAAASIRMLGAWRRGLKHKCTLFPPAIWLCPQVRFCNHKVGALRTHAWCPLYSLRSTGLSAQAQSHCPPWIRPSPSPGSVPSGGWLTTPGTSPRTRLSASPGVQLAGCGVNIGWQGAELAPSPVQSDPRPPEATRGHGPPPTTAPCG